MTGCGRKEGRCPAGSSKEVVVGGGSRHVGAVEKIDRSEEKSRATVNSTLGLRASLEVHNLEGNLTFFHDWKSTWKLAVG